MHGYFSNCVFIHKFTLIDVGDFLLKLCKSSYIFHFAHLVVIYNYSSLLFSNFQANPNLCAL